MSENQKRIQPSRQVIMRLPDTDASRDPWSGAAIETGRNLPDEAPIDEDVNLMPPLGKTAAEVGAELADPIRPEDLVDKSHDDEFARDWMQFSLRDVMILTTIGAVGLASVRWLPPAPLAVVAGTVTLVFLWITHEQRMHNRATRLIGLGLLTLYLIATAAAIVNSWWAES